MSADLSSCLTAHSFHSAAGALYGMKGKVRDDETLQARGPLPPFRTNIASVFQDAP